MLIVDSDLGFIFWLGVIFNEAGCDVLPAFDAKNAISMTSEFDIDIVVMNPSLPGVREMLSALSTAERTPKIVALDDESIETIGAFQAHAILKRPSGLQQISHSEWLKRINQVLCDIQ